MGCVTLKGCSEALVEPFLEAFIVPGHKSNDSNWAHAKQVSHLLLALTHRYHPRVLEE